MIDGLGRYIKVLLANLKSAPLNEWIWTKAVLLKSVVSLGVMVVELLRRVQSYVLVDLLQFHG